MPRSINVIANQIIQDVSWKKFAKSSAGIATMPYLKAMLSLTTINDKYMCDDAESVITYFLSNAQYWKGDFSSSIKKELKELLLSKEPSNDIL